MLSDGDFVTGANSREGCDSIEAVVCFPRIAPLGEHLGDVDLTRPWQRRNDRDVRVLPKPGGDATVQGFVNGVQHFEHGNSDGLAQHRVGGADRGRPAA